MVSQIFHTLFLLEMFYLLQYNPFTKLKAAAFPRLLTIIRISLLAPYSAGHIVSLVGKEAVNHTKARFDNRLDQHSFKSHVAHGAGAYLRFL